MLTGEPPIVIHEARHGLPYSKGLMAQSFTAVGLPPSRAYAMAKVVEERLREAGKLRVTVARVRGVAEAVLRESAGDEYAIRYGKMQDVARLDRPIIIMVGGTTGVGKSTIATEVAHRLGITRITSTDSIREVMRGIFSQDLMPAIYESSFNAWRGLRIPVPHGANPVIVGFREQTAVVTTGIKSIVDRAVTEGVSLVIEGIHVVPGYLEPCLFEGAHVVELVIAVDDEDRHRSHFYIREVQTDGARAVEKYRANFTNIRMLGTYIEELAEEHDIPVVHSQQLDRTVAETLEHVLDAVIGAKADRCGKKRAAAKKRGGKSG
jgi:2-phosphoglycerate kinase